MASTTSELGMQDQTGILFALPRELRDMIYEFYLTIEGGYTLNPVTARLVAANKEPIDLALAYTCKLAAVEMHNLGLMMNTINFFTVFSEEKRSTIGRFQGVCKQYACVEQNLLSHAGPWIDDNITRQVEESYPQFVGLLDVIKRGGTCIGDQKYASWGEAPSIFRGFVSKVLRLIANNPEYCRDVYEAICMSCVGPDLHEFLSFNHSPWTVPTEDFIDHMCRVTRLNVGLHGYCAREKYRTSATATAISYLASLPPEVLASIRHIVLHENHTSTCWPESHAQHLISICQANPNLRIEQSRDVDERLASKRSPYLGTPRKRLCDSTRV